LRDDLIKRKGKEERETERKRKDLKGKRFHFHDEETFVKCLSEMVK